MVHRLFAAGIGLVVGLATASRADTLDDDSARPLPEATAKVDFQNEVAPILREHCIDCHGPGMRLAGLRLDQRRFAMRGGESGRAIEPGTSADSLLIQRLVDKDLGLLMPPENPVFAALGVAWKKFPLPETQINILKRWIDEGADWPEGVTLAAAPRSRADDPERTALFAAIRAGDGKNVAGMLEDRTLVHGTDRHGSTPLMHAALYADVGMMRLLLDRGADVNSANQDGSTALMWAAGDLDKVGLLLEKGARVDAWTRLGRTPLLIAATYAGNAAVVRLLLEHGARVADQDITQETALDSASKRGDVPMVEVLLEAGADVNAPGFVGRAPLVWAAEEGNVATLACLLKHGAGKNRRNLNLALFSAAARGPTEAVRLLLDHGADPTAKHPFVRGYTPLMAAAYSESIGPDAVALLLEKGADPKARAANGDTPLRLARKRGQSKVVERLRNAGAMD